MRSRLESVSARELLVGLGFILGINGFGALPSVFVGSDTDWIVRPWFYPPELLFPIVWTLLFTLLGVSLFVIWRHGTQFYEVKIAFIVFAMQFSLNLAWTPVFFGLQAPGYGLLVIVLLWCAIVWNVVVFARVSRLAAGLLLPYLAWVTFAVALNFAIYTGS